MLTLRRFSGALCYVINVNKATTRQNIFNFASYSMSINSNSLLKSYKMHLNIVLITGNIFIKCSIQLQFQADAKLNVTGF